MSSRHFIDRHTGREYVLVKVIRRDGSGKYLRADRQTGRLVSYDLHKRYI